MSKFLTEKIKMVVLGVTIGAITVVGSLIIYGVSAFTSPDVAPTDASNTLYSTDDPGIKGLLVTILGNNVTNADSDFDSGNVESNQDGNILERTEYIIQQLTALDTAVTDIQDKVTNHLCPNTGGC